MNLSKLAITFALPLISLTALSQKNDKKHPQGYDVVVSDTAFYLQPENVPGKADYLKIKKSAASNLHVVQAMFSENYTLLGIVDMNIHDPEEKYLFTEPERIFIVPKGRDEAFEMPIEDALLDGENDIYVFLANRNFANPRRNETLELRKTGSDSYMAAAEKSDAGVMFKYKNQKDIKTNSLTFYEPAKQPQLLFQDFATVLKPIH